MGVKDMPYDINLDKRVFGKAWEGEKERISVSVYSYNGGAKKLQITRENKDKEGNFRFTKLGRMSKTEALGIILLIQEASEILDD